MADDRIVYGVNCQWWDGIEKVGSRGGLPCCPICRSMLFEMSIAEWWAGVEAHQARGATGYRAFVEWRKGKHFATAEEAVAVYQQKPGRTVNMGWELNPKYKGRT